MSERLIDLATFWMHDWAAWRGYVLILVCMRLAGMLSIGPLFGHPVIAWNLRIMLIFGLGLSLTALADPQAATLQIPQSAVQLTLIGVAEFSIGAVMGLGVHMLLSAFQLAGQLIDQQAGMAISQVLNPATQSGASPNGQFLYLLALTAFLALEPVGGHLWMISTVVESFDALPVGAGLSTLSVTQLLTKLLSQSFRIAIQVAAPLLVTMSLISLAIGYMSRSLPTINVLLMAIPMRIVACLMVLALSLTSMTGSLTETVPQFFDEISETLTPSEQLRSE